MWRLVDMERWRCIDVEVCRRRVVEMWKCGCGDV